MRWDIRRATDHDVERLVYLEQELFAENWLSEYSILRELHAPGLFLVSGQPLVGYIMMRWTPDYVDVTRLGVLPHVQGQGLGSQLLQVGLLAADRPVILTVRKPNHGAIRLYKRHGFHIVGHHVDEPVSWVMVRDKIRKDRE